MPKNHIIPPVGQPSVLGLINARGGSKGVPRKNVKPLCGKPLIVYSIEAGLGSRIISELVVSTEDEEIANIARKWGAQVPFIRPAHLSVNNVKQMGAVLHAIDFLEKEWGKEYDIVVLLQPTSPLRTSRDIDCAVEKMINTGADSVVSFTEVRQHPYQMYRLENERPVKLIDAPRTRRQEFPAVFMLNGAVYAARRDVIIQKRSFIGDKCVGFVMSQAESVNIDTYLDWEIAEILMERKQISKKSRR
jgi:CMP-N-acetylneuraminic acid synthetase